MKKTLIKLLLLVLLPLIPLMSISNAQYHDTEKAAGNYFAASSLDFELRNQENHVQTEPFFDLKKIKIGNVSEKSITVVNKGQMDLTYYPAFDYTDGSMAVCNALELTAARDGDTVYTGTLADFTMSTASAALTGTDDSWKFTLVNHDDAVTLQGKTCEFDIVFKSVDTGFSDTETLTNTVSIAYEPKLTAVLNPITHTFAFTLSSLDNFLGFTYTLDYATDLINEHITDTIELQDETTKTETNYLGTCSDGVCTPQANPHNFILNIGLIDVDGDIVTLTKEL